MNADLRADFPIFNAPENKGLIYFDNAATTQRPRQVIDAVKNFYEKSNANPLRGLYGLSSQATEMYENARGKTAAFLNAAYEEIIFTRNASESLNLVAYAWGMHNVREGDEIAVTVMEHHSNILPWQMVCDAKNAKLVFLDCDKATGEIPLSELNKINERTKLVAVAYVSNVLGITNPVKEIADAAHKHGAVVVVDGAQAAPHFKVDVQDIGADFFAFSGHKMCAPMGIGVLFGRRELLEAMPPFLRGGEMIEYVTKEGATWAELPHKFEAGTVNAAGAAGLEAAIDYLNAVGFDEIVRRDHALTTLLMEEMRRIPHIHVVGHPDPARHSGIVTFTIDGVHPHDIATVLDEEHIAIRAGHHCAQPLGAHLGLPSTARASLYFYNTEDEVRRFAEKLASVRKWMGYGN
ncbi:MAG: aminotransferase class V-fold PLP-dependent enzyme [Treponema sp.]